jgi:GT2 family glycosyltransferase
MAVTQPRSPLALFAVVISTRNRPGQLRRTLEALAAQTYRDFDVIVVDQSDPPCAVVAGHDAGPRVSCLPDHGVGLSRARNLGWRATSSSWVAFLDDDCLPAPDWADELRLVLAEHPDLDLLSGHVDSGAAPAGDYIPVSSLPVVRDRIWRGRWTRPWSIGVGVCMVIRRSRIEALEGFDERLGAGSGAFPASEDMDFNYRLLRAGGTALVSSRLRAVHEQWRPREDLGPLYRDYMLGWCGFAIKHLRRGDVLGGLWLWALGLQDALRMLGSAGRRRSRLRLDVALWKLRGLARGTARALTRRW